MKTMGRAWKFSLGGMAIFIAGCAVSLQPVCRHTALMCALVMQEKYSKVEVAFGPVINANREVNSLITHAQTRVLVNDKWVWVNYTGGTCQLTDTNESFLDLNYWPVDMFYAWLWKSTAPTMGASLPAVSFKDMISIGNIPSSKSVN